MRRRGLWSGHQRSISSSRSRRGLPLLIFLVAGLGSNNNRFVVAEDANPKSAFTFPAEVGMTFYQNDTVLVSYVSSFPDPGLYGWCEDDSGIKNGMATSLSLRHDPGRRILTRLLVVYSNDHAASFNGTQPVLIDFTFDTGKCWWNLRRQFESPDGANSPKFKVADTEREGGSQTISQSSSSTTSTPPSSSTPSRQTGTSTLTTTTSSSTTTSTNGVSSNTSSSSPNDSGGLSTAAAAGIGVAVGVVVIVFLIALLIWLRKWKSNVIAEAVKATQSGGAGGGSNFGSLGTGAASLQGMGELGGSGSPYPAPVPVYASVPSVNNPDMGHIRTASATTAEAAGGVKYYYPAHGSEGMLRGPEEMASDRHTAEMEGDNTYGRKFQGQEYR